MSTDLEARMDPDPLNPSDVDTAYANGFIDGVAHAIEHEPEHRPGWRFVVALLIAGAFAFGFVTASAVHAASRPAQQLAIPAASGRASGAEGLASGNLAARQIGASPAAGRARRPGSDVRSGSSATGGAPLNATRTGTASFVGPSYGSRYLALPGGPGIRVTICGPAACVTRVSTDAGPDLAMQRAGRIADLSYADFATVCGCRPNVVGLVQVTVDYGRAELTPPPTDR